MNTPLPEFLRGVKPGESSRSDLLGHVVLFEFPHGERFPNQRIRQWKLLHGLTPNAGVVMPAGYRSGMKYHFRTKHNQYFVWMANEKAFLNMESAIVFKHFAVYQAWMKKETTQHAVNRELFELSRRWMYPMVYRHTDPLATRHTGEILVLFGAR